MLDRVTVVTGASRGIGRAIALRCAHEGALVAAVARTATPGKHLPGSLEETVEEIRTAGGTAIACPADLSRPEDRKRLVAEVAGQFGPVDILINNAAVSWLAPVTAFSAKRFDLMFSIQVEAPFELARLVLEDMRARKRGWILNVSSLAAQHPQGPPYGPSDLLGTTVYGMCKAALERFSSGLAAEVHADGIAVNSLAPAKIVSTWGTEHHGLIPQDDPAAIEYPEEFAEAAVALCTADPSTTTGMNAQTDGVLHRFGLPVRGLDGRPFVRPAEASS